MINKNCEKSKIFAGGGGEFYGGSQRGLLLHRATNLVSDNLGLYSVRRNSSHLILVLYLNRNQIFIFPTSTFLKILRNLELGDSYKTLWEFNTGSLKVSGSFGKV